MLPLAKSSIRESDTVVQANNGDIIVIGGLMKTDKQEIVSKVPLLGTFPGSARPLPTAGRAPRRSNW